MSATQVLPSSRLVHARCASNIPAPALALLKHISAPAGGAGIRRSRQSSPACGDIGATKAGEKGLQALTIIADHPLAHSPAPAMMAPIGIQPQYIAPS